MATTNSNWYRGIGFGSSMDDSETPYLNGYDADAEQRKEEYQAMKSITVDEAAEKKDILENQIADLIYEFENETGLTVAGVSILTDEDNSYEVFVQALL